MVYNGTYSAINKSLWDPHFAIPIVGSNFCAVEKGTIMADLDIGDILLDFMLSGKLISFYGVDVTNVTS